MRTGMFGMSWPSRTNFAVPATGSAIGTSPSTQSSRRTKNPIGAVFVTRPVTT